MLLSLRQHTSLIQQNTKEQLSLVALNLNGMYLHCWRRKAYCHIYSVSSMAFVWLNPSNYTALKSNTHLEYKSIHFTSLVLTCHLLSTHFHCPRHILRQLPSDKKLFCFLFHVATPVWLKSCCRTEWQDDSRGKREKRNSSEQPDIGAFSCAA